MTDPAPYPGHPHVQGHCPMGCGQTLFLDVDGDVTCSSQACPRHDPVSVLLQDAETEHLVYVGSAGWTIRHPLRERLDDALMGCDLHAHVASLDPPPTPGWYRAVRMMGEDWAWTLLDEEPVDA